MSVQPDHELEILEFDQTIPPRPEEIIADAGRARDSETMPPQDAGEPDAPR
ncbi:MAG TPA: hypothetical protein VFY98_15400 [Intrasporangium sp.]|nr:hypothetical protein [Intrasporangium sp.]